MKASRERILPRKPLFFISIVLAVADISLCVDAGAPISTTAEALNRMGKYIRNLGYSNKVADDFIAMVKEWKDDSGRQVVKSWRNKLWKAEQDFHNGEITDAELAETQTAVAAEINEAILREIKISDKLGEYFSLDEIMSDREMLCVGYMQVYYAIANSVGLKAKGIAVSGFAPAYSSSMDDSDHVACTVILGDGRSIMVDYAFTSKPFDPGKTFKKKGIFRILIDRGNKLKIHTKIRILDDDGVRAYVLGNTAGRYRRKGKQKKAISCYDRVIELDPAYTRAYMNRGSIYDDIEEFEKALANYEKALQLDPSDSYTYYNRGNTFSSLMEYDKAIDDYSMAVKFDHGDALAYGARGNTYDIMGDYGKAISDYTKAIKLDHGKLAVIYGNRANTYYKLRKYEKAIEDFTSALKLDANDAWSYCHRGKTYAAKGDKADARKDFRRAMELDNSFKDAVKKYADRYDIEM